MPSASSTPIPTAERTQPAAPLPAPLHLFPSLLRLPYLSLSEKVQLGRGLRQLARTKHRAVLVLVPLLGAVGLAVGFVIGAAGEALLIIPGLRRVSVSWRPSLDLRHPALRQIARLYAPIVVGLLLSLAQQNVELVLNGQAPGDPSRNITALQSATTLVQFPVGLVAAALVKLIADGGFGPAERVQRAKQLAGTVDVQAAASAAGISTSELTNLARFFAEAASPMAIPGNDLTGAVGEVDATAAVQALNAVASAAGPVNSGSFSGSGIGDSPAALGASPERSTLPFVSS